MSIQSCRERLRGPQAQALERCARNRAQCEERRDQLPRPGEIFAFPETAKLGILWAVIDRDPEDAERFLVVAADLEPLAGSADVQVLGHGTRAAWSVRCRFAVWLQAAELAAAKRTAFLDPEVVEQVRRKRAEIAAGQAVGSAWEQETDAEQKYRDWIEQLEKAHAALSGERPPQAAEPRADVVPFQPPLRRMGSLRSFYALAASILLVASLGLAGGIGWQHQRLSRSEHRRESLEREKERLETVHRQELEKQATEHRRDLERRETGYREQLAELEKRLEASGLAGSVVNLAFAHFTSAGAMRGDPKTLTLPSTARFFLLILETSEDYPRYRLEIRKKDTATPVWASDELTKIGMVELSVLLPRRLFPAGKYRLRLSGLRDGRDELLYEYALSIKSP